MWFFAINAQKILDYGIMIGKIVNRNKVINIHRDNQELYQCDKNTVITINTLGEFLNSCCIAYQEN